MKAAHIAALVACAAFLLPHSAAHAAPFAVDLGDMRLALDAPAGFSDTGFIASPRLGELAESLTSASNRILLFAISDADLRRFTLGDTPALRRYMLAVTPKGLERGRVGQQEFSSFVESALRGIGTPLPPAGNYFAYINAQPRGRVSLLAELRRTPEAVAILQGTRLPPLTERPEEPARYVLSSTALLRLRGKALNLSIYSAYEGPEDLEWIRLTTAQWIEDLERLNNR